MDNAGWVFADEGGRHLFDGGGNGLGTAFEDRLAQADQPFIGVDFEKEPAGFDEKGFELGDFHGSSFEAGACNRRT